MRLEVVLTAKISWNSLEASTMKLQEKMISEKLWRRIKKKKLHENRQVFQWNRKTLIMCNLRIVKGGMFMYMHVLSYKTTLQSQEVLGFKKCLKSYNCTTKV